MTERRKIPDEELVEISGGIDVPLEEFEAPLPRSSEGERGGDNRRIDRKGPRPDVEREELD